jgi:hypothetical protein
MSTLVKYPFKGTKMIEDRKVTERDFRSPEFADAKPEEYEFRADGKLVRKDRFVKGFYSVVSALGLSVRDFEIDDVVATVVSTVEEFEASIAAREALITQLEASGTKLEEAASVLFRLRKELNEKAESYGDLFAENAKIILDREKDIGEARIYLTIEFEKMLCERLGRAWTSGGMSVERLLDNILPINKIIAPPIIKPFIELPLGTRFRYEGGEDVWVILDKSDLGLVTKWNSTEQIKSGATTNMVCSFAKNKADVYAIQVVVVD